jgi:hypothetical protein
MSDESSHNDNDSTWVPEDDDCSVIIDHDEQSNHHDHIGNIGTVHARDNIFVRATSNFNMRDASVLEDTNKLLSPGDVIKYKLRHISDKPKSSTIVMLLDPSTPDKMSLTLANGDIIRPFVHDVKREQMYAGGGGGLLYDPVSTWIKFEECTLNLGCATSVEDNNSGEDNNTDTNEENSMDDSQDSDQGAN